MKEFLLEHSILLIIIALAIIASIILGRWIYKDSAKYENKRWKRILLAFSGLNSSGLITYLLMRKKQKPADRNMING